MTSEFDWSIEMLNGWICCLLCKKYKGYSIKACTIIVIVIVIVASSMDTMKREREKVDLHCSVLHDTKCSFSSQQQDNRLFDSFLIKEHHHYYY